MLRVKRFKHTFALESQKNKRTRMQRWKKSEDEKMKNEKMKEFKKIDFSHLAFIHWFSHSLIDYEWETDTLS